MTKSAARVLRFGHFTIDLERACLLDRGEEVKLRPKVFEALKYLAENDNRLVTKDELIKALWTEQFVTDDSLVQCLVEIRRALGDEAPRCIKTVPRRGYIFIAPVSQGGVQEPRARIERGVTIVALLALSGGALAGFLYFKLATAPPAPSPLTDKDTVLIADFVNTTGDDIFDGSLKHALAVHLGQAPFLNVFSEERIRETLRFMDRSPDEPVTREVAREIAQRQGIKALLAGSISTLGSHYVIDLEAVNAHNGDTIAREQVEAESREQVLQRVGEAASKLRESLGESMSSIEKYDTPIEQVTTPSLEALKAFFLGRQRQFSGNYFEAIPFFERAVELDPDFAIAHAALAVTYGTTQAHDLAAQSSQRAFDLRERTSERERFYISARYYMDVLWDGDKTIEVQELWKQTYPRDFVPRTNLAVRYCAIGQFERALEEARASIRLNPDAGVGYAGVALSSICLNRPDDAKAAIERALARKLEPPQYRYMLHTIALLKGDTEAMRVQVEGVAGTPMEAGMFASRAIAAASSGQVREARELTSQAVDLAIRLGLKENAAQYSAAESLWEAAFGNCREAKATAARTLAIARGRFASSWSALALALCGESKSQPIVDEMVGRFPHSSFANAYWMPMTRAAMQMNHRNPAGAIHALEAASRGETGTYASLWPAYLRGLAYLSQHAGNEAIGEFQRIIDHRGVLALAPSDFTPAGYSLYPLAHLGLARAAAIMDDPAESREAYSAFFSLWKNADSDIPILRRAQEEYRKGL